jgi:hypothetical protein
MLLPLTIKPILAVNPAVFLGDKHNDVQLPPTMRRVELRYRFGI